MHLLENIIILLILIVASNVINRFIPNISLPLIQVLIGLALWAVSGTSLELDSHLFMVLFIAPILYADSEHISKTELWKFKTPVFLMAIGLVLLTVFAVGSGIHWLIPAIPPAACFALAAVLSPTDAVAVKALSSRVRLPHDIIMIAEGECLVNDASGLVAFNMAIAAVMTGFFSIEQAAKSFVIINTGGIAIGIAAILIINATTHMLKHVGLEDARVFTLFQLLTPFVIFILAEELGFSGVLAVVAAGIVHSLHPAARLSPKAASIKYVSDGSWTTLLFVLNGVIFLLLGINLPGALASSMASEHISNVVLVLYVLLISASLIAMRFVWAFVFIGAKHGGRLFNSILIALSGARGAITLAACFSIPAFLSDGVTPFPERDLLLFLSGGVIVVMLLVTNLVLPIVAKSPIKNDAEAVKAANQKIIQAAIDMLTFEISQYNKLPVFALISHYEDLLAEGKPKEKTAKHKRAAQSAIMLKGLAAEALELERLAQTGEYDRELIGHVEHINEYLKIKHGKYVLLPSIKYSIKSIFRREAELNPEDVANVRMLTIDKAIAAILKDITPENEEDSHKAIAYYRTVFDSLSRTATGEQGREFFEIKKHLELRAIYLQKNEVERMLKSGEISHSVAESLRKYIHFSELAMFAGDVHIE